MLRDIRERAGDGLYGRLQRRLAVVPAYDLQLTPALDGPPFEHGIQGPGEIGGRIKATTLQSPQLNPLRAPADTGKTALHAGPVCNKAVTGAACWAVTSPRVSTRGPVPADARGQAVRPAFVPPAAPGVAGRDRWEDRR